MPHRFDPAILREYDIRGIVGESLFAADAEALGRVFAATLGEAGGRRVAVGYDGRLTSPELEAALVEGLAAGGAEIVRIGRGPTPMLYYAAATLGVDGGIMVTGSHNPPDHNGFKMVLGGKPFYAEQIQALGPKALTLGAPPGPRGRIETHAIADDYIARLAQDFDAGRPLNVVWDPGNGATGDIVTALTARLPGTHHLINAAIDGHFPAHHPDPTVPENLVQLQHEVARRKADLGIAFDGDGDRIGVVDATGRILWGDQLLIVLARDVLLRYPGAPILADVKASDVLFAEIARAGGQPVMLPTGHSHIKVKLAEMKAPLAGEMSGHIFMATAGTGSMTRSMSRCGCSGSWAAARTAWSRSPTGCRRCATRLSCGYPATKRANSPLSARSPRGCANAAPRSSISTACASRPRMAGGWCAPRTPRR